MRSNKFLEKAALLCCGYGLMSDAVIVPLATSILREFPDTSEVLLNFIMGGAFLFSLVSALITGRIIHRLNKKKVLLLGTLVYSIASFVSAFAPSAAFLAVTRAIDGLTDGMVGVAVVLAINEVYDDPQERNSMVGLHWTAVSAYGVVLSLLSGFLCVYSWRASLFSNILSFNACADRHPIVCNCSHMIFRFRILCLHTRAGKIEAVDKVHLRPFRDPFKQPAFYRQ